MPSICNLCEKSFESTKALQQHKRDSPGHVQAFHCDLCNRSFIDDQALQQHIQFSPVHVRTFRCEKCEKPFRSEEALQDHIRDSPAHVRTFDCERCTRSFVSEDALQQHIRDSPAHRRTFDCKICNRSFSSEEALQQHTRDSSGHDRTHDCEPCGRSFGGAEALQQHSKHAPAHSKPEKRRTFMFPMLHAQVVENLPASILPINFNDNEDDKRIEKSFSTNVVAKFNCHCGHSWTSGMVAMQIRRYFNEYNAVVFNQRCARCKRLGQLNLDETTYIERVTRRLQIWAGIKLSPAHVTNKTTPPHMGELCEGCKVGICERGDGF